MWLRLTNYLKAAKREYVIGKNTKTKKNAQCGMYAKSTVHTIQLGNKTVIKRNSTTPLFNFLVMLRTDTIKPRKKRNIMRTSTII